MTRENFSSKKVSSKGIKSKGFISRRFKREVICANSGRTNYLLVFTIHIS